MDKVSVTEAARTRLKQLISGNPDVIGVFLHIMSGGCAGYKFKFDYILNQNNVPDTYTMLHYDDLAIAVDNQSCSMIEGLELDYVEDNFGQKFVFNNTKNACGCGKSFSL